MISMIIEKHLTITDADLSVVQTLKSELDLSSIRIKQAIQKGCLWSQIDHKINRLRRLKTKLQVGQQLHFYYNQQLLEQLPLTAELIEDNHAYSIWYKPAGMLCQGSRWGDHTTIYRYVEQHLKPERKAIIVHRLDKMTSGLLILAHQRKIAAAFTHIFEQRTIKKCYRALVHGIFEAAETELVIDAPLNGKSAVSRIQLINKNVLLNQSLLDVTIETGRKHQIRQHLADAGYPVVGDRLYGIENETTENPPDLQLTAYQLQFSCPVTSQPKSYQLPDSKLFKLCNN